MRYLEGKKVLVTGGTGLIGIPLVKKLHGAGAQVRVVSLDEKSPFAGSVEFIRGDLCSRVKCDEILDDIEVVFHLAGIKGSIGVAEKKASTFLVDNIMMNINMMEAARQSQIERFMYASSICIYPPARVFDERNAFTGLPHPSDKFGGMAKMIGEMQIEAYKLQYDLDNFFTVRPANTYGPYDNFNPISALIIPALIYRVFNGENPLNVWGDGSAVRDFIYSDDVAAFMIEIVEKNERTPLNVGSGEPVSIKLVAETVVRQAQEILGDNVQISWDTSKPTGEKFRVTSIEKSKEILGWAPKISLEEGIKRTVRWYNDNKDRLLKRHDIMSEV